MLLVLYVSVEAPLKCWLLCQRLCWGSNWWDTLGKPNKQTKRHRETIETAGWRHRKRKPCNQQSCPATASQLIVGICPAHMRVLHCGWCQNHQTSHTQGDEHVKDSWWGLMKFPEEAVWLSLLQDFHLQPPERWKFGFDLYWLNSGSNFYIICIEKVIAFCYLFSRYRFSCFARVNIKQCFLLQILRRDSCIDLLHLVQF